MGNHSTESERNKDIVMEYIRKWGINFTCKDIDIAPFLYEIDFDWKNSHELKKFRTFLKSTGIDFQWVDGE